MSKGQFKQRASKDQFNGDDMHPDGLGYSEKLLAEKNIKRDNFSWRLPLSGFNDAELVDYLGDGLRTEIVFAADRQHARQLSVLIGSRELGSVKLCSVQALLQDDFSDIFHDLTCDAGLGSADLVDSLPHIFQFF